MSKEKPENTITTFKFDGKEVILRADSRQYILIIERRYAYHACISDAFESLFEWLVRDRLLSGKEKSMKQIVKIMVETRKEILEIIKPFEHLKPL